LKEPDVHRTPFTRWQKGELTPGVEIMATAFVNLWREEWLTRLPKGGEVSLVLVCGLIFGWCLSAARPRPAVGVALAGVVRVSATAFLLFWYRHIWFAWTIPVVVQIPSALVWSFFGRTERRAARPVAEPKGAAAQAAPTIAVSVEGRRQAPDIPDLALLRCVGRGAYGEVWLARDVIGGYQAVKLVYRHNFAHDPAFDREFKGIQKYAPISRTHPGWVQILHVG